MRSHHLDALRKTLLQRASLGMGRSLDRMHDGLNALGSPQKSFRLVHVAGTNGKGSVCAMVESVARAAGLRTGLYTSPHLAHFAERIRIDGKPIDDAAFEYALSVVLEDNPIKFTFFEALTAAAFVAFREAEVDVAIVEVGLGGRLDATNVVDQPLCTAITSIALDHTEILGPSIRYIAREKAGILKPGMPLVLGPVEPAAYEAIEGMARDVGAGPIWRVNPPSGWHEAHIVSTRKGRLSHILPSPGLGLRDCTTELALRGRHQTDNAAVASGIIWQLAKQWPLLNQVLDEGLSVARWPGRLERLSVGGTAVLLDCAHNAQGAAALAEALDEDGLEADRCLLVFGALVDKAYSEMLSVLAPRASRRVYTKPQGRPAAPLADLNAVAPGECIDEPLEALAHAMSAATADDTVVITGSIYLVGQLRAALLGIEADPIVPL